jgi:hypothetical protein
MCFLNSVLEVVACPYVRNSTYQTVLGFLTPDYRPLYDSVVRDLKWFGPDIAQGKMEGLLDALETEFRNDAEAEQAYACIPESYADDFSSVLRQIKWDTCPLRRAHASLRKMHYNNIRQNEAWVRFFSS